MATYLVYLIIALQIADIVTTHLALTSGKGTEGNGLLAWLMVRIGVLPTLVLTKGLLFGWVLGWAYLLPEISVHPVWLAALGVMAVGYLFVIVSNLRVLTRKRAKS